MDKRIVRLFENHSKKDVFFIAADGQGFYTDKEAINHQKVLSRNKYPNAEGEVGKVIRDEYNEWVNSQNRPEQEVPEAEKTLEYYQDKVTEAQKVYDAAVEELGKLKANSAKAKRDSANEAVGNSLGALNAAKDELAAFQAKAQG